MLPLRLGEGWAAGSKLLTPDHCLLTTQIAVQHLAEALMERPRRPEAEDVQGRRDRPAWPTQRSSPLDRRFQPTGRCLTLDDGCYLANAQHLRHHVDRPSAPPVLSPAGERQGRRPPKCLDG